jgi:hypothetical protein
MIFYSPSMGRVPMDGEPRENKKEKRKINK